MRRDKKPTLSMLWVQYLQILRKATVAHWHAQERVGERKTLQFQPWTLGVALPSHHSHRDCMFEETHFLISIESTLGLPRRTSSGRQQTGVRPLLIPSVRARSLTTLWSPAECFTLIICLARRSGNARPRAKQMEESQLCRRHAAPKSHFN